MSLDDDANKVILGADLVGAYFRAFMNLIQWYASFGGQIGFKGDNFDVGVVTATAYLASQVGDDAFRSAVLKAAADYLNRAVGKVAETSASRPVAA